MLRSRYLVVAAAVALPMLPAQAAEVVIQAQNPVVELTIEQTVHSVPDSAQVGAGVQVRAPTATEAMRQNAAKMDKVIAKLRELGIKSEDIQTSNFGLNPQYQYRNEQPPVFLGYEATNQVSVRLRDLARIGATLDALVQAGANNLNGPNFVLEKDDAARASARRSAFDRAKAQATEYAQMAGYNGLKLLEVSETFAQSAPMARDAIMVTAQRAGAAKTPIEPGQVGTSATVTVKFEMTR